MVNRTLKRHKKKLQEKFTDAEFSHLEDILKSQKSILKHSSNLLFFSVLIVIFFLTTITSLVVLPFEEIAPKFLFYGIYSLSSIVLGILAVYFIHINPEFEKNHHLFLACLFVIFSFVGVTFANIILKLIIKQKIVFISLIHLDVAIISSIGLLIPYLWYWEFIEK